METSELALGTWAFAGNAGFWTDQQRGDSLKTLHLAIRSGITSFDTAYAYQNGRAEQLLGQQLKRFSLKRETLRISTKTMGRDNLRESLRRLITGYVDIWYLHWPSSKREMGPVLRMMAGHREAKAIGICNATPSLLNELLKEAPIRAVQVPCNLLWIRNMAELRELCKEKGIFLSGYSPAGMGVLSGRHDTAPDDTRGSLYCYRHPDELKALLSALRDIATAHGCSMSQVALAWARGQGFDEIVTGARTKAQLSENLLPLSLTRAEIGYLTKRGERLNSCAPPEQDNLFGHRW